MTSNLAAEVARTSRLIEQDRCLVQIYIAACASQWGKLASITKDFYRAGGSVPELRGCLRHLIVLAGYGPCLAAFLTLQKAKLLPEDSPAKIGGPPGNAFELVYDTLTDPVRKKVHGADPALGEWIRLHLYGDVYSSPGIDLRRKQLLMCARLSQADMMEQLFGHAIAAMRFGNSESQLEEAIELAFDMGPSPRQGAQEDAIRTLKLAAAKYQKDFGKLPVVCPEVEVPDASYVHVPSLFVRGKQQEIQLKEHLIEPRQSLYDVAILEEDFAAEEAVGKNTKMAVTVATNEDETYKAIKFAWEELEEARNSKE